MTSVNVCLWISWTAHHWHAIVERVMEELQLNAVFIWLVPYFDVCFIVIVELVTNDCMIVPLYVSDFLKFTNNSWLSCGCISVHSYTLFIWPTATCFLCFLWSQPGQVFRGHLQRLLKPDFAPFWCPADSIKALSLHFFKVRFVQVTGNVYVCTLMNICYSLVDKGKLNVVPYWLWAQES